jgi:hypothetical protein
LPQRQASIPWTRYDKPLLEAGTEGAWDDHCTTNPSFIKHPNGEYWLYYKSWNTKEYQEAQGAIRGNRKYGLAIAKNLWDLTPSMQVIPL